MILASLLPIGKIVLFCHDDYLVYALGVLKRLECVNEHGSAAKLGHLLGLSSAEALGKTCRRNNGGGVIFGVGRARYGAENSRELFSTQGRSLL